MRNTTDISPWCDACPEADEIDLSRFRIVGDTEEILKIVRRPGVIDIGHEDILAALTETGTNYVSTGVGHSDSRLVNALKDAIGHLTIAINNARAMIVNIQTGEHNPITMPELNSFSKYLEMECPDVDMIWGVTMDEHIGEHVKITLIIAAP